MSNRHYYRCRSCCHVVAVEGKLEYTPDDSGRMVCKTLCVCDGKLDHLGRVARSRGLVLDSERCPCDARCTAAPGPSCSCRCGGENHGSGRVVPVELDAGGIPRIKVEDVETCRARAEEFRRAMAPLRERLRRIRQDRLHHYPMSRVPRAEQQLADAIAQIVALRTHAGRLKAIAKLAS